MREYVQCSVTAAAELAVNSNNEPFLRTSPTTLCGPVYDGHFYQSNQAFGKSQQHDSMTSMTELQTALKDCQPRLNTMHSIEMMPG